MCLGYCNTDFRNPERIGNIIYYIKFPESKQNRAKCTKSIQPQYKGRQTRSFSACHTHYLIFLLHDRCLQFKLIHGEKNCHSLNKYLM